MPRWLSISLRIAAVFILLLIGLWIALVIYIQSNKKQVLAYITEQLSEQMEGKLEIKDMQPSLWRSFPDVSVALKDVTLRDSLYKQHHHSLVELDALYVKLNSLALLRKKIEIKKITASRGKIYLFVDNNGYNNLYLFKKKNPGSKKKTRFSCNHFALEDILFQYEEQVKNKMYEIRCKKLDGTAQFEKGIWQVITDVNADIGGLNFNRERGAFLKNTHLRTELHFTFNPATKELRFKDQDIRIDTWPLLWTADVSFKEKVPAFKMQFQASKIPFDIMATWLSDYIFKKIDSIHFDKPVWVNAYLDGHFKYLDTPDVKILMKVIDNKLTTPLASFTHCSFDGLFSNVRVSGAGHTDANAVIVLKDVSAKWKEVPFKSDSIRVENLAYTKLELELHTTFPLAVLGKAVEGTPFYFKSGVANIRFHYKGGVKTTDTLFPVVNGTVTVKDGAFEYLPRALKFDKTNAQILLQGDDLYFTNLSFHSPHSYIKMKGVALHFFKFYFTDPQQVFINWDVASKDLDLGDFLTFVGKRKDGKKASPGFRGTELIIHQLDEVLNKSNVQLQVGLDKLHYRKFEATDFKATAALAESSIELREIKLKHAGGSLLLSGLIKQDERNNPFSIKATISNAAIHKLFYAFENFGQSAIDYKNVQGQLNASCNLTGKMTEGAKIIPGSLNGNIKFSLEDGALVHFEPLENIGKIIFRKRDMSNIIFKNISNDLHVAGSKILIPPMNIVSSALYMKIQGVYATPEGTDIAIQIPVRNPQKDGFDTTGKFQPEMPHKKGLVIYLRARNDETGKVKMSWDPLMKGIKATDSISRN